MTFDYKIIPVRYDDIDSLDKINGHPEKRKYVSRRLKKDRRKYSTDRRSSVRDGVIVDLSYKNNRRKGTDRRKQYLSKKVV